MKTKKSYDYEYKARLDYPHGSREFTFIPSGDGTNLNNVCRELQTISGLSLDKIQVVSRRKV
jgi:hypothetical protein